MPMAVGKEKTHLIKVMNSSVWRKKRGSNGPMLSFEAAESDVNRIGPFCRRKCVASLWYSNLKGHCYGGLVMIRQQALIIGRSQAMRLTRIAIWIPMTGWS